MNIHWILPDLGGERAVDALGLAGQADRLSDLLVPELSVTTTRARYFSFLCWAVDQAQGAAEPITAIHRLEGKLALDEAERHGELGSQECPGIVGRALARAYLQRHDSRPAFPERLYVNTAFATYRPAMRALGLVTRARRPTLTIEGRRLAAAFSSASGRGPKCLSEIPSTERKLLRSILGLHHRQVHDEAPMAHRRKATLEALRTRFAAADEAVGILERSARPSGGTVAGLLHRAFIWEHLSLGLGLAFGRLLYARRLGAVAGELRVARKGRHRGAALDRRSGEGEDAARFVVAHLRTAVKLNAPSLGLDPRPFEVAAYLVRDASPRRFLDAVYGLHVDAKPDGPWIRLAGDRVHVLATAKQDAVVVAPRSYRLDAFGQLCREVGAA